MREQDAKVGQRITTVDAGQLGTVEQVSRNLLIVMDDGRRCVFHASEVVSAPLVWCENVNAPAHGNGIHTLMNNCRNPHVA